MKIAIIGGTGFVGGYLVDAFLSAGHNIKVLVRPGSEGKLLSDSVQAVPGDLASQEALNAVLDGCDAVIYNVGLLREFPRRGITFEQTQYQGVDTQHQPGSVQRIRGAECHHQPYCG